MRPTFLIVAVAVLAITGTYLLWSRQYVSDDTFYTGAVNTPVVYRARVMPYIIDTKRACTVPQWLQRGVYIAQEACEDGVKPVAYGTFGNSWWNMLGGVDSQNSVGYAGQWTTSKPKKDVDMFYHALMQCEQGSHMACLIMDSSKGPFHRVKDPLTTLTSETMAPLTNEDTVHYCGKSYKDCVVVPASIIEPLVNRNFSTDFTDDEFKEMILEAGFFHRQMNW